MLKVSSSKEFDILAETNNAVILGEELKFEEKQEEKKVCECEARVRAYMRMLRAGEGTEKEVGYTKLFGHGDFTKSPHNKDMSDHPKIKVYWYTKSDGVKVYSSAAGAYQVMGYTWDDTNMKIQRKVYGIKDFSPLNQDLFCIIIFKHKRKGMLKLILEGKIQEATEKYGSYEWASLPPGRYGQPSKTMKEALKLYDDSLKDELAEKSNLHLEKGFLKKFGVSCKCGKKEVCLDCRKEHIDLADESKWVSQFDIERPKLACWRAFNKILMNYGLKEGSGYPTNLIQTVLEQNDTLVVKKAKEGLDYLDEQINKKFPVLVGVNHTLRKDKTRNKNINEGTTDHFIVIVGRGCEEGRIFYRYFEVGTYPINKNVKGINANNKLYLQLDNKITGEFAGGSKTYTITQVRRNKY
ncbi:glycoside hydrolase family 104 protein [Joostella atrarenae]|uniref:Glycoside hydrolase family 104 protein n=1 Tax=Joostella atrarenae TaxID=679257 RepID=A0ABS9J4H3_9FLAO|nr:glycoside hydrolase family 104 protein [Joostella atrarenae]MCF8715338.1 glycoside hydrolase family 104 protein [Joostella atrarenae]